MENTGWWKHIKQWMTPNGSQPLRCSTTPVRHELINRSVEQLHSYQEWKQSDCRNKALSYIFNNYNTWLKTPCEQCQHIDFLRLPSSNGFVLHLMDTERDCNEMTHLLDFLKEKVISLGYRNYVSDVRFFKRKHWVERNERHYLKPPISFEETVPRDQRFGNINIELLFRDETPLHLKFSVSTYKDHQFSAAKDFGELMEQVLLTH